jgi:hypothetical protein
MKRDLKFFLAATLIAVLTGFVPIYLHREKERDIQALLSRPPAKATRILRQTLASCTEVRVHRDVGEVAPPEWDRTLATVALGKSVMVLQGRAMQDLIAGLHAEHNGISSWHLDEGPHPGAAYNVTALEFYSGTRWLADIRFMPDGLRWYAPLKYKGDAPLLPESRWYLEQKGISPN